ncbi:hypothetical protein HNO53_20635 [Billgrantia antri]|uniref:Uncharacterized protein n=1 Tax=Halomonas sulfidivorans TaxID=2733488 RepID=A0ABX7WNK3_9GAMM|nr:hypothetical protein [Halomonas sulfidivorans]QTP60907.1 hypothetical protein HNO53_20635 [Halomonas sulfidivorans]
MIVRTARLAFQIEAAERREYAAKRERLRALVEFHYTMADLLARTDSWSPEGQAKVHTERAKHMDAAQRYRAELKQLEGGGA